MFEENKHWSEYVKGQMTDSFDNYGVAHLVEMTEAIEAIGSNLNGESVIPFIKSLDAYFENAELTEELAKHFIGSWLQVVKSCAKDDKEWNDDTISFLKEAVKWMEE